MRQTFYFGYKEFTGHVLQDMEGNTIWNPLATIPEFPEPWVRLMDGGLLTNVKEPDMYTGKVIWTCAHGGWFAFVWWDRSGDRRGASNSGLYVRGFDFTDVLSAQKASLEAFVFGCAQFPKVMTRQTVPLLLQIL